MKELNLVDPADGIYYGAIEVKGYDIVRIKKLDEEKRGLPYLLPGFVDPHTHGAVGVDFIDATYERLQKMEGFLRKEGVAACLLTTVSAPLEKILKAIDTLETYTQKNPYTIFKGVHLEGPYLNPNRRGAHELKYIRDVNVRELEEMVSHPLVRLMTVAPEIEGFEEILEITKKHDVVVSIGHTEASYELIEEIYNKGVRRFTHLCNGMKPLHHREVGPVGGALLNDAFVEVIVDGIHLCGEMVRIIRKLKGVEKLELITDSMAATGLGDGEYRIWGKTVHVRDGIARTEDGSLAGSTLTMRKAVSLYHSFTGADHLETAKVSSYNVCVDLGLKRAGRIKEGYSSLLVEIGPDFEYIKPFMNDSTG